MVGRLKITDACSRRPGMPDPGKVNGAEGGGTPVRKELAGAARVV